MKEAETTRKCIVSGEIKGKEELLRFTHSPNGDIIPDFMKKLPGKGIYVSASKKALEQAVEKNLFAKVSKRKTRVKPELLEMTESILKRKGLESINLARKAGVLITGFEKVIDAVKKKKVMFLLEANDAGKDGRNKISSVAGDLEIFTLYSTLELDTALDKINTVHAAFVKSEMSKKVREDFKRLQSYLEEQGS